MSTDLKGEVRLLPNNDTRVPWRLTVSGLKPRKDDLLWEQFVQGGFTVYDDGGGRLVNSAKDWILKTHPVARIFGEWIEDFPMGQVFPRGKRKLEDWAKCKAPGGRRGTPSLSCGIYVFDDYPGLELKFGELVVYAGRRRRLIGVEWSVGFHHKIWIVGQESLPYYEIQFFIKGGRGNKLTKVGAQQVRSSIPKPTIAVRFARSVTIPKTETGNLESLSTTRQYHGKQFSRNVRFR
jgi:hypothetical protein